ncbi:MAG TPA: flagellin [Bryobacteraceae bacterium]|jgi:flagellar hook-associated protein 3 FlgL
MISSLDSQAQQFLTAVNNVQQQINTATERVSSGLKVRVASDEPDVVSELLQLRTNLQVNTQITNNLSSATTDTNISESALSQANTLLQTAISLAAQGATGTATAATRQELAGQVQAILQQMVSCANTQSGQVYVFGGDAATNPPYQIDVSSGNGVDQLTSAAATRQVQNPAGGSFAVSQTAQQIFDDRKSDGTYASDNVFAALTNLYNGLMNNDQTAVENSTTALQAASNHLNESLAFYGTVQDQLQNASNFAASYNTQLQTQIGQLQDADVTAASLELSEGTTQLQAAFAAESRIPQTTLFNYLTNS